MTSWPNRAGELLEAIREKRPMIHHMTNNVVTNFTANVTLCIGAAPVMAPCDREVEQMVSYAGALLLNIGTLDDAQVQSMLVAGRKARELEKPVVLDPVGAGATDLRTVAARTIMEKVKLSVIRGNAGEVFTLAGAGGKVRGVDSMEDVGERDAVIAEFARREKTVVAVTGAVDVVTDGTRIVKVKNGHPILGQVTGTGCAATTVIAAFLAVSEGAHLEATASALAAMGLAAEVAAGKSAGPGTFVPQLLDALAALDAKALKKGAKIEEVS
jgi:hydroxyethylthiazole kinase